MKSEDLRVKDFTEPYGLYELFPYEGEYFIENITLDDEPFRKEMWNLLVVNFYDIREKKPGSFGITFPDGLIFYIQEVYDL